MICSPLLTGAALLLGFWALTGGLVLLSQDDNGDIRFRRPTDAEEAILCGPFAWVAWLAIAPQGGREADRS